MSWLTFCGLAVVGFAGVGLSSNASGALPSSRIAAPRGASSVRAAHASRGRAVTASCAAAGSGTGAFDSTIQFMTNKSETFVFGGSNLAHGGYSGVFEGSGDVVCDYNSVIGGGYQNIVDSGAANTPSGAAYSFIGAGQGNAVSSTLSFVGGGFGNTSSGSESFVGAGASNSMQNEDAFLGAGVSNVVSGEYAFLGAGETNIAQGFTAFAGAGTSNTVSGTSAFAGAGNQNAVSGTNAFVGAGNGNSAHGTGSFVGAGNGNEATGAGSFIGAGGTSLTAAPMNYVPGRDSFLGAGDQNAVEGDEAFIGSGVANTVGYGGSYASILGGNRNAVSGEYASVLGGFGNSANGAYSIVAGGDADFANGTLSFAAGYHADATHDGSFVWSDYRSGSAPIKDTAADQFVARASGGVYLYSNEAATTGVKLGAGSGTWASLSDRNAKTDVAPLDDESVLSKVSAMPIGTWRYKSERGVRHVGPMAQDFYSAFGVGEDDRHITSIDEDGVALAAIQALAREMNDLRLENAHMKSRLALLEGRSRR